MDDQAAHLASILVQRLRSTSPTSRIIVGLSGVPASGKSTLAQIIVDRVNETFRADSSIETVDGETKHNNVAVLIGLDGWHMTRAQLDAFPDPKLAHDRRGAHWTFDGESYVNFMRALRHPLRTADTSSEEADMVYAPSFDHAIKDPTPRAVPVHPYHRLVLIEGLYTFLGIPPWREAAEMLDERWWLDVGEAEAEDRLVARHVKSGIAKDLDEAKWRSRENDAPNGQFIRENMLKPTRVIKSLTDLTLITS
ncbi:hypothetical protein IEO21_03387 [Rhodonia placenta]|uniref:P-loop containing nucleoside triphosphate hydrolase protein n=1 Tax=Rhodonia placenta TaxID=104341 RepID=A0A8H7U3I3_9APHY|nr:hypothetical protein IEO21_03387 [Postia placenta]